jgi:SAM-dependent methyltransferase
MPFYEANAVHTMYFNAAKIRSMKYIVVPAADPRRLNRFYAEARRVLKPDGILAASAYNLLHIEKAIDDVVNRYYHEVVGPFWPPERRLVEQFAKIPFAFGEIDAPNFEMTAHWNLDHLLGYLRTWSSTQRFIAARGSDPLDQIIDDLCSAWGKPGQKRSITWPLIIRIGRK